MLQGCAEEWELEGGGLRPFEVSEEKKITPWAEIVKSVDILKMARRVWTQLCCLRRVAVEVKGVGGQRFSGPAVAAVAVTSPCGL